MFERNQYINYILTLHGQSYLKTSNFRQLVKTAMYVVALVYLYFYRSSFTDSWFSLNIIWHRIGSVKIFFTLPHYVPARRWLMGALGALIGICSLKQDKIIIIILLRYLLL
jgi:hypothetical protein